MSELVKVFQYTHGEERANVITHSVGFFFAVFVLIDLSYRAILLGSPVHLFSYFVYGGSLMLLYFSSTAYHLMKTKGAKILFKKLDHISIFFLIAGTNTPFFLINIGGEFGLKYCAGIWSVAMLGTIYKLKFTGLRIKLSVLLYVTMGWMAVIGWDELVASVPARSMDWIIYGGVIYTVGTLSYMMKKVPYHHMVWHSFVLGGSVCHYIAIKLAL